MNTAKLQKTLENNDIDDLKEILENFDVTAKDSKGSTCLRIACCGSDSAEAVSLVIDKIMSVGSTPLLKEQFSATDNAGWNLLMSVCRHSKSPAVVKVVFEKMVAVGGTEYLKSEVISGDAKGSSCLGYVCLNPSYEVLKLVATTVHSLGLFKQQYEKLALSYKAKLANARVEFANWHPDPASVAEVETVLGGINFFALEGAIHSNQRSRINEILKNDDEAKKILAAKQSIIMLGCAGSQTTIETMKLLFSQIKRVGGGGNHFLKEALLKENIAGETCILFLCLHHPERLELLVDSIEDEIVDDESVLLADLIAKKGKSDGMTCLLALCKFAPKYDILLFLVTKIFQTASLGRRYLREQLSTSPCFESMFSRRSSPDGEEKYLGLMAGLSSATFLFEEQFSRFGVGQKETLGKFCKIESAGWSRSRSTDETHQPDIVGLIKHSIKQKESKH